MGNEIEHAISVNKQPLTTKIKFVLLRVVATLNYIQDNKYLAWMYGVERKICHSGSLFGITRQACMVWIEKSVMRVTVRHHEACRVMPNSDPE